MKKLTKTTVCLLLISIFSGPLFVSAQETWKEKIRERWKQRLEQRWQQKDSPSSESSEEKRIQALYDFHEGKCPQKGWQKIEVNVNGLQRKILWKGPEGSWKNGAIIVMHGGGGTYSNFCSNIPLGKPMVEFGALAVAGGFAVFSLESTYDVNTDSKGYTCGKGFDSLAQNFRPNTDLPFIGTVINEIIPQYRPSGGAEDIFMTGISNGGFMTILASTRFDDEITAFAPVSTGDPYGTHMDCSKNPAHRRNAPGIFVDNETNKMISKTDACRSADYPNEEEWYTEYPDVKPSFKQFQHQNDAAVDISCMKKAQIQLVNHGYKDDGPFIIKHDGRKKVLDHFWLNEYNQPIIDFFKKHVGRRSEAQFEEGPTKAGNLIASAYAPPLEAGITSSGMKPFRNTPRLDAGSLAGFISGNYDLSIGHQGMIRRYLVHVPDSYREDRSMPIVLAFHGGGGDAAGSVNYFQLNEKADREDFIVVYPEGTGVSVLEKTIGSWNAGECCPPAKDNNVDDVGFVRKIIEQLKRDFNVNENRIYATGMSNGAMMVYALACELSDTIAAIAPVGAHDAYENCNPARPVPVIHFHGTLDPCAPYDGAGSCGGCFVDITRKLLGLPPKEKKLWTCSSVAEYIEEWRRTNGCSGEKKITFQNGDATCVTYQHCRDDAEVTLCTIENMGHTWPGRTTYSAKACRKNPYGRACSIWKEGMGPLSDDINANDAMWEFFERHPMR